MYMYKKIENNTSNLKLRFGLKWPTTPPPPDPVVAAQTAQLLPPPLNPRKRPKLASSPDSFTLPCPDSRRKP
jgi:hypothetical protein